MYTAAADRVWREFDAHLSGNRMGLWCVVSERPLGEAARQAIANSAAALGFGEDTCTFVTLKATEPVETASVAGAGCGQNDAAKNGTAADSATESGASDAPCGRGGTATEGGVREQDDTSGGDAARTARRQDAGGQDAGGQDAGGQDATAAPAAPLGRDDLFLVVEGIDPLRVVAADVASASALAATYRQDVPLDAHCRLFGRDAVAFRQFESLLGDDAHKQKAWALLKKLPRLD